MLFGSLFRRLGHWSLAPVILILFLSWGQASWAEDQPPFVTATMLSDTKQVQAGHDFKLGVDLAMKPGWHTYYKESGEAGMPTRIEWHLPEGFKASDLVWQRPQKFTDSGITTYGYHDETVIAATITPPANLASDKPLSFKASVKWLSCKDACVPGKADVELTLPVGTAQTDNAAKFADVNFNGPAADIDKKSPASTTSAGGTTGGTTSVLDEKYDVQAAGGAPADTGMASVFFAAFVGGLILNLMPCVLPVISIKIFSLMQSAGDDSKKILQHGLVFTGGILSAFLVLGLLVIALQGAGQKIGWGFQFQYPVFVFAMACFVTVFALAMFGVFYIAVTAGQSEIDKLASKEGLGGSFFKGVLATLLSTPCSAPFLGTALGFAFSQPGWLIISIFLTIGLGMSSPYILLCAQPDLMKYMPKPGTWMEKFKESMGFLLMATVVWLIDILAKQVGTDSAVAAIGFLLVLSFACWLSAAFIDLTSTGKRKAIVYSLVGISLGAGWWFFLKPHPVLLSTNPAVAHAVRSGDDSAVEGMIAWQPFSVKELDKLRSEGKTVFVDFTAEWCLTCKTNESTIINTAPVIEKIKALKVVPMKADWTAQDAEITTMLSKFGRSGVPVYAIWPGNHSQPIVLPEGLISQQLLLESLDKAGASK